MRRVVVFFVVVVCLVGCRSWEKLPLKVESATVSGTAFTVSVPSESVHAMQAGDALWESEHLNYWGPSVRVSAPLEFPKDLEAAKGAVRVNLSDSLVYAREDNGYSLCTLTSLGDVMRVTVFRKPLSCQASVGLVGGRNHLRQTDELQAYLTEICGSLTIK